MLLDLVASKLVLNPDYVDLVSKTASMRYKRIQINKKSSGVRVIYHPARELKVIQRVIHDEILSKLRLHDAATAYSVGTNTKTNADLHAKSRYLLRLDFKNFFESISRDDVFYFTQKYISCLFDGWTAYDSELFSNLVCFNNRLTVGSVTSPQLSNCMCYELDMRLSGVCAADNVKYSRYADDMFFSSDADDVLFEIPTKVKRVVRSLDCPSSLWINFKKTVHSSNKSRKTVAGLVLTNKGEVSIGRGAKRRIRSMIHSWKNLSDAERRYLSGYLSYSISVDPDFINRLYEKYGASLISEIRNFR